MNFDRKEKPYIMAIQGEVEIESLRDRLIISPFFDFPMSENMLKQKERTFPIEFNYINHDKFQTRINIPKGFEIDELPIDYYISNEVVIIDISYKKSDNVLEVSGNYLFRKTTYAASDYEKIKAYINIIVEKFNQQIVFQKKV